MPRKRTALRSRGIPPKSAKRPSKRKVWTTQQMEGAMKAVVEGGLTANRAAIAFRVPVSTLKDRLTGRVQHGRNPGPRPYLTTQEESELSNFLKTCVSTGYGKLERM